MFHLFCLRLKLLNFNANDFIVKCQPFSKTGSPSVRHSPPVFLRVFLLSPSQEGEATNLVDLNENFSDEKNMAISAMKKVWRILVLERAHQ